MRLVVECGKWAESVVGPRIYHTSQLDVQKQFRGDMGRRHHRILFVCAGKLCVALLHDFLSVTRLHFHHTHFEHVSITAPRCMSHGVNNMRITLERWEIVLHTRLGSRRNRLHARKCQLQASGINVQRHDLALWNLGGHARCTNVHFRRVACCRRHTPCRTEQKQVFVAVDASRQLNMHDFEKGVGADLENDLHYRDTTILGCIILWHIDVAKHVQQHPDDFEVSRRSPFDVCAGDDMSLQVVNTMISATMRRPVIAQHAGRSRPRATETLLAL